MSGFSRRELLRAAAVGAAGLVAAPVHAIDPPARTGKSRLKLGLAAYSYRDYLTGKRDPHMDLSGFIDRAAQVDLDGVELTSYYFPREITETYVARLKRQCAILGLDISGSPVRNTFTYPPGPARDREIAHVQRWLDYAAWLGSPCIRIFAGDLQPGQTLEQAQRNTVECIEICSERAEKRGVLLALENHGGIVAEADSLLAIVRAVRSDWCGVNLDTGNFRTTDPYADLERCAPYAVVVQMKTEVQPKGQPKQEADLKRVMGILKRSGYRGYVTLEYEAAEEPLRAVPRAIAQMRKILAHE